MKKIFLNLFCLLAIAGSFASCGDDDGDTPVAYGDAELISFGFYAEDNKNIIFKDYVVSSISSDITLLIPDYVDKSSLIARFTSSKDDIVTVNGVQQESGVTKNNFTVPVDYIVSEGTNNVRYSITVGKLPDAVWSFVTSDAIGKREFVMKVNPVNNMPYIAFAQTAEESINNKAGVLMLKDGSLVSVGGTTITENRAAYLHLTFSDQGIPFISFSDYSATLSASASVMSYDNSTSTWNYVGTKGITDAKVSYNDVVVKSDGNPMLFCFNNSAGTLLKRELNISDYNGSTWSTNITMPGRLSSQYALNIVAKQLDGNIYVTAYDINTGSFSVYKDVEGTWSTIANNYLDEGATSGNMRDFDMDVDNKGNVFIAIADNKSVASEYWPKVKKYDAQTKTWSTVGSYINLNLDDIREFSLAVSPAGIPFLMYRNENQYPVVVSFDEETQDWSEPTILSQNASSNLFIDFGSNGVGYASFQNSVDGTTGLYKYDLPN